MASRLTGQEEELSCPVCHNIFKHPVVLSCGHSFCKDCLQGWWMERTTKECPVCQRRTSKENPLVNFALKSLCEKLLEDKGRSSSSMRSEVLCTAHGEKLKLFCLDDEQPVCVVCRDSKKHTGHKFLPMDEASGCCKQKFQETLKLLKEKLEVYDEAKTDYGKTESHIKVQARITETQIKEQFEYLHWFLREDEEARVAALREEVAQKSKSIKCRIDGLSREMEALSNAIQASEDQLKADDQVSFLKNYKTTMAGFQLTLQQDHIPPVSGALINEATHLKNMTFRVWDKMKDFVSYTPVLLDTNTAHPCLMLSDDLTSVRRVEQKQQLPDNPERFDYYVNVLGSEGFNSRSHSWDVEVGDNKDWEVGVCVEPHQRKGHVGSVYWCIWFYKGEYKALSSSGVEESLSLNPKPCRIRVQLDWDRGQLSFSDPDSNTHLHTFTHTFTETLFPYVYNDNYGPSQSLKMLPGKISVTLENHC